MVNFSVEELEERFNEVEEFVENQEDDFEDKVFQLEEDVQYEIEMLQDHINGLDFDKTEALEEVLSKYENIAKKIKILKSENDFYDEDAELDRMFPNRYDDDFDEDSMSYDSVFGSD